MKKMSLRAKMLLCILPVMAIAMIILTYVATNRLSTEIESAMSDTMKETVVANANNVDGKLEVIRTTCINIAEMVSTSYQFVQMDNYKGTISKIINNNDSILGSGVWFEPYMFDKNEMYVGPYWYKEGTSIVETYDYSNAEYDYLNQEYYLNAKALSEGQAVITNPYYDPTSGKIMSSCSAPIYDNGTYVGCVTVDMELTNIEDMVKNVKVGKSGTAMLIDSAGTYIYCLDDAKVQNGAKITEDENASLASLGSQIVNANATEPQMGAFVENGKNILLTYVNIPGVDWDMAIRMDIEELDEPVKKAGTALVTICIVALVISAAIISLFVMSISKSINNVKAFAGSLASGDFTVDKIVSKSGDELGQMSDSLNNMFENNRDVISKISDGSIQVSETSTGLASMASELSSQFTSIQGNISGVNDAMMSSGAATEQVNASVEEVNASVHQLAAETEKTSSDAADIKARAKEIEKESRQAHDYAISIAEQREADLIEANEKAKIVDQIGTLADTIAEIADQINLLSLNASIEAARAGEHGRGFAVVASEINNLAVETQDAVSEIQNTVDEIQKAFDKLKGAALELVDFMENNVTPDYQKFISIGQQYGKDANTFGGLANQISDMVDYISESMEQVSAAVASIAESATETASSSAEVTETISESSEMMSDVAGMANDSQKVAEDLDVIVKQFSLKDEE